MNVAVAAASLALTILVLEGLARFAEREAAPGGTTLADYS